MKTKLYLRNAKIKTDVNDNDEPFVCSIVFEGHVRKDQTKQSFPICSIIVYVIA